MVLILVLFVLVLCQILKKRHCKLNYGGSRHYKVLSKSKPNDKNIKDFQVPRNNLTFYPHCKVLLEMQFPYKWNSKNRIIDQIVTTIGIPEIGPFQKLGVLLEIHKSEILKKVPIFGIHKIGKLMEYTI